MSLREPLRLQMNSDGENLASIVMDMILAITPISGTLGGRLEDCL